MTKIRAILKYEKNDQFHNMKNKTIRRKYSFIHSLFHLFSKFLWNDSPQAGHWDLVVRSIIWTLAS